MVLHIADKENEPFDTILDSDVVCFPPTMFRILKMIPVFNIIYGFWSRNNIQLDTVFESLKKCDTLLPMLQVIEDKGDKYIYSSYVNFNEEMNVIPASPLKEMLDFYKKYRDEVEIVLKDSDLTCIKEYFYEFVRRNCFKEKNSRFNSVFFYENLSVASMANSDSGRKFGKFAEVEIIETRSMDRCDLRWLTDLKPTCLFAECQEAITNYWKGEMTSHPKIEILFSGKYVLKELK